MKKILIIACFLAITILEADVSLNNLEEGSKIDCLTLLEKADNSELWKVFLGIQTELFFDGELRWMTKEPWLQDAENILEIGSGSGAYLSKLANQYPEKSFQGVELLANSVKQANESYAKSNLTFQEGNAEIFDAQLTDTADIILFRLTLQHLEDPIAALKNAWHYLSSNGYVFIIDACDSAKRTSHPIRAIDEALALVAESQHKNHQGNRKITLELLKNLQTAGSPLGELYEVAFSNLDSDGHILYEGFPIQRKENSKLYLSFGLLFLNIIHRTYHVPVDLNRAYDELQAYLDDKEAWSIPGKHFLVLKRL